MADELILEPPPSEAQPKPPRPKKARRGSAYELPTAEKRAFGARLKEAREIAGMSQSEAAERLGYSQQVQLSLMEAGNRPPTVHVVIACAKLYGTTTDYLLGLAPDSDRDPVVAVQRHAAALVAAQIQRLTAHMARLSADTVRELMPSLADGQRMAGLVLELHRAISTFHELNPRFENMRGSATVLAKARLAHEAATQYVNQVDRGRRLMAARTMRQEDRDAAATEQVSLLPILELTGGS